MRLDGPESQNIDDRRGGGFGGGFGGGNGGGIAVGGLGGVVLLILALVFGVDPSVIMGGGGGSDPQYVPRQERPYDGPQGRAPAPQGTPQAGAQSNDAGRRFIGQVLRETEQVWNAQFQAIGRRYEEPVLVLFSGATQSGCGAAQAQTGPFYCPNDRRVYIDLDFMAQLQRQLRAGGDFAAAYIVAHEVGHHVQNLLGILPRVQQAQARGGNENALQVRVELQADCLAGVWANQAQRARNILEDGDIEEGMNAAAAVGDDRVSGGRLRPESFTHGSSRQRVQWFRRGLEQGNLQACDTFSGN
ncbi:KPN_02809 family neutral zinc metallopeptidase [Muricoccus radiodurans]|uniref:KPN_02809 family neutral zinc metallopeptidase n=1 Tax=Muricoccus radiodurans TaxID=2231721 RepID=UPI003CF6251F